MDLVASILCDFAQVREGLLTIVGGGITRLHRENIPAAMGCYLALMIEVGPGERGNSESLAVTVVENGSAEQLVRLEGQLQLDATGAEPGESVLIPFVIPFVDLALQRYGLYDVRVNLGDQAPRILSLYVLPPA